MDYRLILQSLSFLLLSLLITSQAQNDYGDEPPEGYYAFVESANAIPPKVRPPPYTHVNVDCKNVANGKKAAVSVNNICGDLNKGQIPKNPLHQNVLGEPYPFELIRNHTLKFLSKTLPVLKADDTLPKVTQIIRDDPVEPVDNNNIDRHYATRTKREAVASKVESKTEHHEYGYFDPAIDEEERSRKERKEEERKPRKFCDGGGIFCTLYKAIQGDTVAPQASPLTAERREEIGPIRYEGPPTPCPAKVEYATPVFAKNYQGSWRYVVQIPYEGYFTQTVEVTRCIQARCHYLDGGCLSSPRWVSLLVAEIFYPNAEDTVPQTSTTTPTPSVQDFQAYQQYLQKRAGVPTASDATNHAGVNGPGGDINQHCDGHDELGCFQVRLYYDWFLIPGSCKCWRPDYFAKYVRRKSVADFFCTLYKAIQGDTVAPQASPLTAERREEIGPIRYEGPPTPCPAKVEYATPVFAKNYQGSWRYVVQIPYEGYFTQTVEVTRCIQARCHYLDGGCLSSPRWVSLLVAEIFYPNAEDTVPQTSTTTPTPSVQDFQAYQQYLQKRAGVPTASDATNHAGVNGPGGDINQHCDGHDELGCFQVRLYYDWFLIPGSCKCWRPDYFAKYVRRKSVADL